MCASNLTDVEQVDNGKHEKFVRMSARNRDGDIVLGIPLPPESATTLADQLREAAASAAW